MAKQLIDTLATSQDMDHLWGTVNAARDGSIVVKIDKATLTRLLLDHGKLLNYYEKNC
jgi:hypothetical protein